MPDNLLAISVQSSSLVQRADDPTQVRVQCTMTDGSVWTCKLDGSDWQQLLFSFKELTDKFHAELKTEEEAPSEEAQ